MRIFVAITITDEIRARLAEVQRDLRAATHSVRWVAPESIHLTLKFIGEVPEKKIEAIDAALRDLAWKPFTITVRGVGFFPGTRSPRIFWAGLETTSMAELATEIDSRLEALGFEKERRAFRPHITLARAKETRMETALVTAASRFDGHEFGSFIADRFFLIQSTLRTTGPVYAKLKEYPLERR